ncbi:integrase (plasmid) [Rhodococcus sp. USK10]|nr:integrase [Rhodococcus sp. USK10]
MRGKGESRCKRCRRRHDLAAARRHCPRCGRDGYLREHTGWCGPCSQPGPAPKPAAACTECGRVIGGGGARLCNRCQKRRPQRPYTRAENLLAELDDPPNWLWDFTIHVSSQYSPEHATRLVSQLGALLRTEPRAMPQTLLDRARIPGHSIGSLANMLEDFFTARGLALPTDQSQRLAADRRTRRVQAVPEPLRPAVAAFERAMLDERDRARRAGTRPRADSTIDKRLAQIRDLSCHLVGRGIEDWAQVDKAVIEDYLAEVSPAGGPLGGLRHFFRFARRSKLILIDPTAELRVRTPRGFHGRTLPRSRQRELFTRWSTSTEVAPNEALVGLMALIHGASQHELRHLQLADIDPQHHTVRLGRRPHPIPLDPATWAALTRCLEHRRSGTHNPHVIVTSRTRSGPTPASRPYLSRLLDPADTTISTLRASRLLALANSHDPNLIATTYGMSPEGVLAYFADRVDPTLLADL